MSRRSTSYLIPSLLISCLVHGGLIVFLCFVLRYGSGRLGSGALRDGSVGVRIVSPNDVESIWREANPPDLSPELWAKMSFGESPDYHYEAELRTAGASVNTKSDVSQVERDASQSSSTGGRSRNSLGNLGQGVGEAGLSGSDRVADDKLGSWQRAQILSGPTPPYPESARAAGFEGVALLRVEVSRSGLVTSVELERSSGCPSCDQEAISTIKNSWVFSPATDHGRPAESTERVQVVFKLDE